MQVVGLLLIGVLAGVCAGMFGIGGGLIIVPALVFFYRLTQHAAVGTSLGAILLPVGALSAWVYWKNGNLNVGYFALIAAGSSVGALLRREARPAGVGRDAAAAVRGVPDRRRRADVLAEVKRHSPRGRSWPPLRRRGSPGRPAPTPSSAASPSWTRSTRGPAARAGRSCARATASDGRSSRRPPAARSSTSATSNPSAAKSSSS